MQVRSVKPCSLHPGEPPGALRTDQIRNGTGEDLLPDLSGADYAEDFRPIQQQ